MKNRQQLSKSSKYHGVLKFQIQITFLLKMATIRSGRPPRTDGYTACENVSRRSRLHNASCENRTPCVFPSQVWHQLICPWGSVNGSPDIQCLRNGWSCVIKRWLSNFCLQNKTAGDVENVIMMINNELCISTKRKHKLYSRYARNISYLWYFKRFNVEVFNASLWKILQRVYLTTRRSTSLTVQ